MVVTGIGKFNLCVMGLNRIKYRFYESGNPNPYMIYDFIKDMNKRMEEKDVIVKASNDGYEIAVICSGIRADGEFMLKLEQWGVLIDDKVYDPVTMSEGYRKVGLS